MKVIEKNRLYERKSDAVNHAGDECPSCKMIVWFSSQVSEKTCPFCCHRLPSYISKIVPERIVMRNEIETAERKQTEEADVSPFTHEFFMVQGRGFRCMAYHHKDGKWRGAFDNQELPGAIRVLE